MKKYIVKVEMGNTPKEQYAQKLESTKKLFQAAGIKNCIYIPTINGVGDVTIERVK